MGEKQTMLVVDDNPLIRQYITWMGRKWFPKLVVLEAERFETALQLIDDHHPFMVITEACLKQGSGLLLTEVISETYPDIVVTVFTLHDSPEYKAEAMKRGAHFFVSKIKPQGASLVKIISRCLSE